MNLIVQLYLLLRLSKVNDHLYLYKSYSISSAFLFEIEPREKFFKFHTSEMLIVEK